MVQISDFFLKFFGWTFESHSPVVNKCVLIAAPHTSNWDFPMMLAYGFKLNLKYSWLGKHTLFFGPLGLLMRKLGGIPVDRSKKNDYVSALSEEIRNKENCILIIPPEGTRSRVEYWKSGFLYIARTARVPIVFGKLDYSRKKLSFSQHICSSLSNEKIMKFAQDFYRDATPLNPSKFGPVRLKQKD